MFKTTNDLASDKSCHYLPTRIINSLLASKPNWNHNVRKKN